MDQPPEINIDGPSSSVGPTNVNQGKDKTKLDSGGVVKIISPEKVTRPPPTQDPQASGISSTIAACCSSPEKSSPSSEELNEPDVKKMKKATVFRSAVRRDEYVPCWINDDPNTAAERAHSTSKVIHRMQHFLFDVEKLQAAGIKKDSFDIVVKRRSIRCKERTCQSKCPVDQCGICPHVYECSCQDKDPGTNQCPHIHLIQDYTGGDLQFNAVMFIQHNWRYTETRHQVAIFQGLEYMKKTAENVYEETFHSFHTNRKSIVTVKCDFRMCSCPNQKVCTECTACRCQYECNCYDFSLDRQLCVHVHSVAIQLKPKKTAAKLFFQAKDSTKKDQHCVVETEDIIPVKFLNFYEHQMSFFIKLWKIVKVENHHKNTMQFRLGRKPGTPEHIVETVLVKVAEDAGGSSSGRLLTNRCVTCRISLKDYKCKDCSIAKRQIICRHIHSAHRLEKESKETPASKEQTEQFLKDAGIITPRSKLTFTIDRPIQKLNSMDVIMEVLEI